MGATPEPLIYSRLQSCRKMADVQQHQPQAGKQAPKHQQSKHKEITKPGEAGAAAKADEHGHLNAKGQSQAQTGSVTSPAYTALALVCAAAQVKHSA